MGAHKLSFRKPQSIEKLLTEEDLYGYETFSNVCPQIYLDDLMHSRGYSIQKGETIDTESYVISDPRQRPGGYNSTNLLDLARKGDDLGIVRMVMENSTLCLFEYASSRGDEGETLIHLICKYCTRPDTLQIFLEQTGVDIRVSDEFGRTPLHYACWRDEPCFRLIDNMITSKDMLDMFLLTDLHGSTPLSYVPRHHWNQYISYINSRKNAWFIPKSMNPKTEGQCAKYYSPKANNHERRTSRTTPKSNNPINVVTTTAATGGRFQIRKKKERRLILAKAANFEKDVYCDDDSTTYNAIDDSEEEYYIDIRQEDQAIHPPSTGRRVCFKAANFEKEVDSGDDSITYNVIDDSKEEYYIDLRQEDQAIHLPSTRRVSCF